MKTLSGQIREEILNSKLGLLKISSEIAGTKPAPNKWSKKEILGHLIDSASNNHQRFVRAVQNIALDFPAYNQDRWVEVQHYNEMDWTNLIELFSLYNSHLCRVIEFLPPESFDNPCNIGKEKPVTLRFIAEDYLRHLKHHMEKILEKSE